MTPGGSNLTFTYTATLITGERLPTDFIEFNTNSLRFTVESENQDLDESYSIEVYAKCTQLNRTKKASFELTVNTEDPKPYYFIFEDEIDSQFEEGNEQQTQS